MKQYVKYINTLGDSLKASTSLRLEKEYEIKGECNIVIQGDSYLITNDNNQSTYYFKTRFSKIIER